jgi:Diaminopimelate decarboxylase
VKKDSIHVTSPGLRDEDIPHIAKISNYMSFNSQSQWQRCKKFVGDLNCGLRINPELSFVEDDRFNPCRGYSKLGIPLSQLAYLIEQNPETFAGINGIHIHNNCESENFQELGETINKVKDVMGDFVSRLKWINVGGGYLFSDMAQLDMLCSIVTELKQQNGQDVFFEPGKGIVNSAGYLIATVIDLFDSGGKTVAVLDTTVNHLPEVFEYQYKPVVMQEYRNGEYEYQLVGASCLSGDLFGDLLFC